MANCIYLVTSGDLRPAANRNCWPAQAELEAQLQQCISARGYTLQRAFPYAPVAQHGFISSQRMGMDIFAEIPTGAPLIFATAAWQYTHHVLAGLRRHRGPILTIANWSGQWPGLVGLLNLNGSLVKAGVRFSTLWSKDFDDSFFLDGLAQWLASGHVDHDLTHVRPFVSAPAPIAPIAQEIATALQTRSAILGVFDEGCMGMYNAILDDELLNPMGIYKERLSQSALVARMSTVSTADAQAIRTWLDTRGLTFKTGTDEATELTDAQILDQCRMYVAAVRIAKEFGCDAIGIQYQQGLKDMAPASDLVEGLLNNPDRPPVFDESGNELYPNAALPHFNEVDEGAAVDALITNRCWMRLDLDPSTTLHDLRWGEHYKDEVIDAFVWVLQISGAAPASHFVGGYAGSSSERQPPMYFPLGGGTLKGVGRPGQIVWSRVFQENGKLHADIGRGSVVLLPESETNRRWSQTTPQWPLVSAIFHGISRDSFMARHRANHVSIAYATDGPEADRALALKAETLRLLGVEVHLCGTVQL
ncbi:fucose isomerase [Granulicella sp. WH15]|uniref:fucose isomerase n=1 Tax=Granulicella sp. WH15 TaxID=2602070 RepID=UPI001366ACA6|nr:fucose isomerase [Granulicella sp. WH15]QHN04334.1 fucose isomerase [Granulicella sp. WH15]